MKIKWYGHSCFTVTDHGYTAALDPFSPNSVPGCPSIDLSADIVICSHGHGDHNYEKGVRIVESGAEPFKIEQLHSYHDGVKGLLRGKNLISILDCGGKRAAHFGDLGCVPTSEQLDRLRGLDVIMIPVGGHFTIDGETAARLVDELKPKLVIPMHYRGEGFGYPVISTVESFLKAVKGYEIVKRGAEVEADGENRVYLMEFDK